MILEDAGGLRDRNNENCSGSSKKLWISWPVLCEVFALISTLNDLYALKACIEEGEGCYHAKGMYWVQLDGMTFDLDLVTLR